MSRDSNVKYDVQRYRPLGLMINPFADRLNETDSPRFDSIELETLAESNRLLGEIVSAAGEANAKPLVVIKSAQIPAFYPLRAVGAAERAVLADDNINVLHAYVQLFMMRLGRIRSIIAILSERLAFHEFDKTLEYHVANLLKEPQTDLVAYQVLGEEGLAAFAERFSADPAGTVQALFGEEKVERRPELAQLADTRISDLQSDVDEDDAMPEIDSTLGDAPANAILLADQAEAESDEVENNDQLVVDYIVEYTKAAFSPVIARALRVYRERGLSALIDELKVTKAPKKTLAAIVRFARQRFDKVVLIFDGFDAWFGVPPETKSLIAGELSEIRWKLEDDAVLIFMLEEDGVVELEEQFGGGKKMRFDFAPLQAFETDPQALVPAVVDSMLASAAAPGAASITTSDPVIAELMSASTGFSQFAARACAAFEDAADRGVSALDEASLKQAMAAPVPEAQTE